MKITGNIWSVRIGQRQRGASMPPSSPPRNMISFAAKHVKRSTSNSMSITSPMNRWEPKPTINSACFVINVIPKSILNSNQISYSQPRLSLMIKSSYKNCSSFLQNIITTFQHFEKSSKTFNKTLTYFPSTTKINSLSTKEHYNV